MFDRACAFALWTNGSFRIRKGCRYVFALTYRQLVKTANAPATEAILVKVAQQRIIALVIREHEAHPVTRGLECPAQMKRNVEVQRIAAASFNLLKIDPAEFTVLSGEPSWGLLLATNEDQSLVTIVERR